MIAPCRPPGDMPRGLIGPAILLSFLFSATFSAAHAATAHLKPGVVLSTSQLAFHDGQTIGFTATITNNDPPSSGPSDFYVQSDSGDGIVAMPRSWMGKLSAGQSVTIEYSVWAYCYAPDQVSTTKISAWNYSTYPSNPGIATAACDYDKNDCRPSVPTLTLSPAVQEALAGTPVTFTVTVKNNDSAACPATTFNLINHTWQCKWTIGGFANPSLLIEPGKSASTTFTVYPPATGCMAGWDYRMSVEVNKADCDDFAYIVSESTVKIVTSLDPPVRANPGVSLSPASLKVKAGETGEFTLNVKNNDHGNLGGSSFSLLASAGGGCQVSVPGNVYLTPGQSAPLSLKVTPPAGASGTLALKLDMKNLSAGGYSASCSATVEVTASGSPPPPPPPGDPPGSTSGITVTTDKATHLLGQPVNFTVKVMKDGKPVAGAKVIATVTLPSGQVRGGMTPLTRADGTATLGFRTNFRGVHQASAKVYVQGVLMGSASASFTVK
jgi:hypothetical protein